jgi:VWFA-related protein
VLDLCPLPNTASADLRSKPGYIEFAVSPLDRKGLPIVRLNQSDFVVSDAQRSYPIAYFSENAGNKTPASIIIVDDVSATMFGKTAMPIANRRARTALDRGADAINECDEVGVVTVGGKYSRYSKPEGFGEKDPPLLPEISLLQPFTTANASAISKIENVIPAGADHLPEGIKLALSQLENSHYPARVIVILSDGLDRAAVDASVPILEEARAKGIGVWIIGVGDRDSDRSASASPDQMSRLQIVSSIERLRAAGAGRVLFAQPVEEDYGASLGQAITTVGQQVGQGYSIGVLASSPNATPQVSLTKPDGTMLRTAVVPPKLLADVASRHPLIPEPQCIAGEKLSLPPASVASKLGYRQFRVSVVDANAKPVRGLKQSDFVISADPRRFPAAFLYEYSATTPKSLVIAIDSSDSMEPKLETVRSNLGKLITGLNHCDEVALVAFRGRTFLLQKLTTDHSEVVNRLSLMGAYGATALYDAIDQSLRVLSKANYRDRAIILVTDGMDNSSLTSRDTVLSAVASNQVSIYAIGIRVSSGSFAARMGMILLGSASKNAVDTETLKTIATRTGGTAAIVPPMSEDRGKAFAEALADLGDALNSGYEVGFVAPSLGTTAAITVTNHSDYVVRVVGAPSASNETISAANP